MSLFKTICCICIIKQALIFLQSFLKNDQNKEGKSKNFIYASAIAWTSEHPNMHYYTVWQDRNVFVFVQNGFVYMLIFYGMAHFDLTLHLKEPWIRTLNLIVSKNDLTTQIGRAACRERG